MESERVLAWLNWWFANVPPLRWWFTIDTDDADTRRRASALQLTNLAGLTITPFFSLAAITAADPTFSTSSVLSSGVSMLGYLTSSALARRGHVDLGGGLICVQILINLLILTWIRGEIEVAILLTLVAPMFALLCMRPSRVLLICILTMATQIGSGFFVPEVSPQEAERVGLGFLLMLAMTPLMMISSVTFHHFMGRLMKSQASLEAARKRAEEASVAKSAFLANVSHELRTPLNAVLGYSEILLEDAEESGDTMYLDDLTNIRVAGKQLAALVDDVLDLAKIEEGKLEVQASDIELGAMLDELRATITPAARRQANKLEFSCPSPPPSLRSDGQKLRQILLNLLSNAAKFTRGGTIGLEVSTHGEHTLFTVSDTGLGLSEDDIQRIFAPFAQAHHVGQVQRGTGLGLSLSLEMARLLGGDIEVRSEQGVGSTFTVKVATLLGA